jgi:membrane-anchored protein YejM (alkaline phosphatase superfamily)
MKLDRMIPYLNAEFFCLIAVSWYLFLGFRYKFRARGLCSFIVARQASNHHSWVRIMAACLIMFGIRFDERAYQVYRFRLLRYAMNLFSFKNVCVKAMVVARSWSFTAF